MTIIILKFFILGMQTPQVCLKNDCQCRNEMGDTIDLELEIIKDPNVVDLKIVFYCRFFTTHYANTMGHYPPIFRTDSIAQSSERLKNTLNSIPPVKKMKEWVEHQILRLALDDIDPFLYPTLTWILTQLSTSMKKVKNDQISVRIFLYY